MRKAPTCIIVCSDNDYSTSGGCPLGTLGLLRCDCTAWGLGTASPSGPSNNVPRERRRFHRVGRWSTATSPPEPAGIPWFAGQRLAGRSGGAVQASGRRWVWCDCGQVRRVPWTDLPQGMPRLEILTCQACMHAWQVFRYGRVAHAHEGWSDQPCPFRCGPAPRRNPCVAGQPGGRLRGRLETGPVRSCTARTEGQGLAGVRQSTCTYEPRRMGEDLPNEAPETAGARPASLCQRSRSVSQGAAGGLCRTVRFGSRLISWRVPAWSKGMRTFGCTSPLTGHRRRRNGPTAPSIVDSTNTMRRNDSWPPSHLPGSRTVHSALQAIAPATPEERALMKIAKGCIMIAFFAG